MNSNADTPEAVGPPVLSEGLGPNVLKPRAWAIFVDSGNARMWTTFQPHVQRLADAEGLKVTALYELTTEEVAAVNKLRARKEWMKRETHRCRCDHNEYCHHCWPESFRPGGVWHGLGA